MPSEKRRNISVVRRRILWSTIFHGGFDIPSDISTSTCITNYPTLVSHAGVKKKVGAGTCCLKPAHCPLASVHVSNLSGRHCFLAHEHRYARPLRIDELTRWISEPQDKDTPLNPQTLISNDLLPLPLFKSLCGDDSTLVL